MAAAGAVLVVVPWPAGAAPSPTVHALQARDTAIAGKKRSAILSLYSLDARVATAYDRLASLKQQEVALRSERALLEVELRLADVNARRSQQRLAARVRALYDGAGDTTLDVLLGATSLTDALTQLDDLDHVTSVNTDILGQLHSARAHELRTKARLAAREARLAQAIREASAQARSLAGVRAARSSYVARLSSQEALDAEQIARLQGQAQAAELKSQQLTEAPPAAGVGVPVTGPAGANSIAVISTGYCLTGTTATGIPVGWGVAAVDPSVIPLGTHLTIPGYGEAVAADTGSAIIGDRIDLWFPSCAEAGGWGSRPVTIALH